MLRYAARTQRWRLSEPRLYFRGESEGLEKGRSFELRGHESREAPLGEGNAARAYPRERERRPGSRRNRTAYAARGTGAAGRGCRRNRIFDGTVVRSTLIMAGVSDDAVGMTAMMVRGVLICRYGHRLTLILGAMPHCHRSHSAQRQREECHEQDQRLQSTGHFYMLARAKWSLCALGHAEVPLVHAPILILPPMARSSVDFIACISGSSALQVDGSNLAVQPLWRTTRVKNWQQ